MQHIDGENFYKYLLKVKFEGEKTKFLKITYCIIFNYCLKDLVGKKVHFSPQGDGIFKFFFTLFYPLKFCLQAQPIIPFWIINLHDDVITKKVSIESGAIRTVFSLNDSKNGIFRKFSTTHFTFFFVFAPFFRIFIKLRKPY